MKTDTINWEERRFQAATQILSGMCANLENGYSPSPFRAGDAVRLADYLIKALSDPNFPSVCADLYQRDNTAQ